MNSELTWISLWHLFERKSTEPICTEPLNTIKTNNNSLSSGVNSNSKNTTHYGSMKGLKVVFLNIDRLYDQLDELRMFANEHSPHIICLNETKLESGYARRVASNKWLSKHCW